MPHYSVFLNTAHLNFFRLELDVCLCGQDLVLFLLILGHCLLCLFYRLLFQDISGHEQVCLGQAQCKNSLSGLLFVFHVGQRGGNLLAICSELGEAAQVRGSAVLEEHYVPDLLQVLNTLLGSELRELLLCPDLELVDQLPLSVVDDSRDKSSANALDYLCGLQYTRVPRVQLRVYPCCVSELGQIRAQEDDAH